MEKPMWETAKRNCRTRVKGAAHFGIEEPLYEVRSRNQTARKNDIRLREVPVTCWVVLSSPEVDFGAFPVGNT